MSLSFIFILFFSLWQWKQYLPCIIQKLIPHQYGQSTTAAVSSSLPLPPWLPTISTLTQPPKGEPTHRHLPPQLGWPTESGNPSQSDQTQGIQNWKNGGIFLFARETWRSQHQDTTSSPRSQQTSSGLSGHHPHLRDRAVRIRNPTATGFSTVSLYDGQSNGHINAEWNESSWNDERKITSRSRQGKFTCNSSLEK